MKKTLRFTLCMTILLSIFVSAVASQSITAEHIELSTINSGSFRSVIFKADYGDEDGQIAFKEGIDSTPNMSAESFRIGDDGRFYILNSVARKISIFAPSGKYEKQIEFECLRLGDLPILFDYYDGNFAILVTNVNEFVYGDYEYYVIIASTNSVQRNYIIPLTCNVTRPSFIEFDGDEVLITTEISTYYTIDVSNESGTAVVDCDESHMNTNGPEVVEYVTDDGNVISINTQEGFSSAQLVGYDSGGNLYFAEKYKLIQSSFGIGEMRISVYDRSSREIAYAIIGDWIDNITLPFKDFYITPDATLYYMYTREDALYISKVNLGNTAKSVLNTRYETESLNRGYNTEENSVDDTSTAKITLTRSQVKNRAVAMVNVGWSLKASHLETYGIDIGNITIPPHVITAGEKLNSTTTTVTMQGIPYSYGGKYSVYAEGSFSSFANAVSKSNMTAGNISSYIAVNAFGIDCSGFVCSAYNVPYKNSTYIPTYYGNRLDAFTDMRTMDFFQKDGHVMLLGSTEYNTSEKKYYFWIYEAARGDSLNKTIYRRVSESYIINEGYTFYTPWQKKCSNSITYNSSTHTLSCTVCGLVISAPHTYTYSNITATRHTKACNLCSYSVSETHNLVTTNEKVYCATCGYTQYFS